MTTIGDPSCLECQKSTGGRCAAHLCTPSFYVSQPDALQRNRLYLAFTGDVIDDKARLVFATRYGSQPLETVRLYGLVFVGPLPEKQP